jgi:hypothetical protein
LLQLIPCCMCLLLCCCQVGNYPGRALSFSIPPGSSQPQLHSLPSKRVGLYAPHGGTLIARSDTNGEDLEAFAGAGLYDRCGWLRLAMPDSSSALWGVLAPKP